MAAGEILLKWVSESGAAIRDMKRVERSLGDTASKTERSTRRMAAAHKVVNGALVAWMGTLTGVAIAYGDMVKGAQEDAAAQAVLANVARRQAGATDAQVAAMEDYITAVGDATLYTDDQLRPALGDLISVTNNTTEAQDLLTIAMDAATSSGKNVDSVSRAVAKAHEGNMSALQRLFPWLDDATIKSGDFAAVMKQLEDRTKGASKAGADQNQWGLFVQNLDEVKESLGGLANSKGGTKALKNFNDELLKFKGWVDENPDVFNKVVIGIAGITAALVALKGALSVMGTLGAFASALKKFPVASGIGAVIVLAVSLYESLKDVDDGASGALGSLKRFWSVKDPFNGNWWVSKMFEQVSQWAKTAWGWVDKLIARLNQLLPSWARINDAGTGVTGGAATGAPSRSAAPKLVSSSVGKLPAAAAVPVTNVYVNGQRTKARTVTSPWQPQISLGVI